MSKCLFNLNLKSIFVYFFFIFPQLVFSSDQEIYLTLDKLHTTIKEISEKKIDKNIKIFLQINIGKESQKSGIKIEETKKLFELCRNDLKLEVIGLMCIPPENENVEKYFSQMFKIKEELGLNELSMGMSNDYLEAISSGSSFVRIGSKIFGDRN